MDPILEPPAACAVAEGHLGFKTKNNGKERGPWPEKVREGESKLVVVYVCKRERMCAQVCECVCAYTV